MLTAPIFCCDCTGARLRDKDVTIPATPSRTWLRSGLRWAPHSRHVRPATAMADASTVRPMNHVTMTLNSDAVLVEGSPVVAIRDGAIDSSEFEPDTASIAKVSSLLRRVRVESKKAARASDSAVDEETLNLVIDKLTSWTTVAAVVNSASIAGYSKLEIIFKTPPKVATSSLRSLRSRPTVFLLCS